METILNLIDGSLSEPRNGAWLDDIDPATSDAFARLPDSGDDDIAAAVSAAERAAPAWGATPAMERSRLLFRLADLIQRDLEPLAAAESRDAGKPLALARRMDIPRAAANFRFFAGAALHTGSDLFQTDNAAVNLVMRRPVGVAALISPWNLPLYLLTWKIAPALASGCTAVAKPSEVTPLTAFLVSRLAIEAGLPAGVLNIVHGAGSRAGAALVAHPGVKAVSCTGGTSTGAAIAAIAAPRFKKLSLELGGKNANIIFADADMDAAVDAAARAAFTNSGQICLCGSRILVERRAYPEFLDRLTARAAALRVGDPLDPATDLGPLVSRAHLDKVRGYIDLARNEGGHIRGGELPTNTINHRCARGFFLTPAVITGLDPSCRTMQEEIFGPVVTVTPFDTEDEALAIANGTRYGLAAMLWTSSLNRAHRLAPRLDAGVVWVNCWMVRDLRTPFGGVKDSGVGREGGDEALRFFTEPTTICINTA